MSNPYVIPFSWRNLALIVAGAVALWGGPWLVWPSGPGNTVKAERLPVPVFRYIRAAQGLDGSTWSPVLMPLPTPDGFSKKAALKESPNKSLVSVLKPKISGPVYMTMPAVDGAVSVVPNVPFLRPAEFDPEVPASPVFNHEGDSTSSVIRFEIQEPLRYRQFAIPALQGSFSNGMDVATLSVTADIEVDKTGFVQHVLLEQPAGIPAVDSAIVRGLRAGWAQPGASNTWGRVRIFYWKNSSVQKE